LGDLLAGRSQTKHLRILEPATGALYYRDPDIPERDQRLALRAESTGHIEWSSSTLDCRAEGGRVTVGLREGRHQITARDTATGEIRTTWIEVDPW
jgi:penicillin-binding protein 1C